MKTLFSAHFWSYAGERAIKTGAQTFIATVGTTALITEVEWAALLSIVGLAVVMSLATSLAGDWKAAQTPSEAPESPSEASVEAESTSTPTRRFEASEARSRVSELLNKKEG